MSGKAVGRVAASVPWLCPNTDSLIRLAEAPAGFARPCAADPALLALLLRFAASAAPESPVCETALASATLPDVAHALLRMSPRCWAAPTSDVSTRCRALATRAAALAARIAEHTGRAAAGRAFAVAALAPLGWLAVAATDPSAAHEALNAPEKQAELWGYDQNAIARRLANRWRLPDWIATALGNLNLPLATARAVVADVALFAVAQLAVLETERREPSLQLTAGADRAALLKELSLDDATLDELWAAAVVFDEEPATSALDPNPHNVPLLPNLLKIAVESRRRNGAVLVARLEDRLDDLHAAVARVGADADRGDRAAKMAALAELAAGAGHEINNPLAVISGYAQRLFRTEPAPERGESLQTIIRQTQRIAGIVRDLMQFARPPRPTPARVCVGELLVAVRAELAPFATEKGVELDLGAAPADVFVRCDAAQIKHALAAVVRNGIEAAGTDGWVKLGCADGDDEQVAFAVEDSGPGLTDAARAHCFDPFFCGRSAGRGRGLGLPTAWQFARQNGGDVRHEPTDGPTRFVLTVPRSVTLEFFDRQSA